MKVEPGAKGNCNECGEVRPLLNYPNDSICEECRPKVKKSFVTFDKAWGVVKGWEDDLAELERQMDSMPADMCQICRADLNEEKNLSANQHRVMMETGAFPDVCIKCQKEHGLSGDF